jgi:hypothetical protein
MDKQIEESSAPAALISLRNRERGLGDSDRAKAAIRRSYNLQGGKAAPIEHGDLVIKKESILVSDRLPRFKHRGLELILVFPGLWVPSFAEHVADPVSQILESERLCNKLVRSQRLGSRRNVTPHDHHRRIRRQGARLRHKSPPVQARQYDIGEHKIELAILK